MYMYRTAVSMYSVVLCPGMQITDELIICAHEKLVRPKTPILQGFAMIAALQRSVLSQARCRLQQAAYVVATGANVHIYSTDASLTAEDALYSQGAALNAYSGVVAALLGSSRGRQVPWCSTPSIPH
jgi:hypothetical protein